MGTLFFLPWPIRLASVKVEGGAGRSSLGIIFKCYLEEVWEEIKKKKNRGLLIRRILQRGGN